MISYDIIFHCTYHTLLYHMIYHFVSSDFISFHIISYVSYHIIYVISYDIMLYHCLKACYIKYFSCYFILKYILVYHFILYQIISYHISVNYPASVQNKMNHLFSVRLQARLIDHAILYFLKSHIILKVWYCIILNWKVWYGILSVVYHVFSCLWYITNLVVILQLSFHYIITQHIVLSYSIIIG